MCQGWGTKTEKEEEKKKRKLPRTSLHQAPRGPAQARDHGGVQIQFIGRVLSIPVACRDGYAQCTLCKFVEISQVQLVGVPVVVRQGSGPDAQITVEVPQLQFLAKVVLDVV